MALLEVDDNGLQISTFDATREWIAARVQAKLGSVISTQSLGFVGQMIDVNAELAVICMEAIEALYAEQDPAGARGVHLDRLGALIGSLRRGESQSTVEGLITFVGFGEVPDGTLIRHDGQSTVWQSIGGPYSGTDEDVEAVFQAVDAGPLGAIAGSSWTIVTSVPGFSAFTNPTEDATPGQLEASDVAYRQAQAVERYGQGQGPTSAIRARVSRVNTANGRVDSCRVWSNPNYNPEDADGLKWKQTLVVVETTPSPPTSALQQDIHDALWIASGAGCWYSEDSGYQGTVIDSEGNTQNTAFDIVTTADIYIVITLGTPPATSGDGPVYPKTQAQMATVVHEAVHARAQELAVVARDARESDYYRVVAALQDAGDISGVDTIAVQLSGTSKDGPYTAGLVGIGRTEKIEVDTVNVRVIINGTTVIA